MSPLQAAQRLTAVLAISVWLGGLQKPAHAVNPLQFEHHLAQAGEMWGGIAARYGIPVRQLWITNGVANPRLLAAGQLLFITDTASRLGQARNEFMTVTSSFPLFRLAVASGYPLYTILLLNDLEGASGASGQQIVVPHSRPPLAHGPTPPSPTEEPVGTESSPTTGPALIASRLGIQGYFGFDPIEMDEWLTRTQDAGFTWVKYQVSWKATEYPPDQYPAMATLDAFMNNAERHHLNVLLSVVKAPDWARDITELDGPPREYIEFTSFVQLLATRYKNRLDKMQIAIEIWNEPNTQREWNGAPLSASDYVRLLAGAYVAIKSEDQKYTVISAGLAPTGINDGVTAIDDREYLRQMYEAGLARVADAIGAHPYGWANSPRLRCCKDPLGPQVYDDDPRFFFLNTIDDYRTIQAEYGDSDLHDLWATEFGWATMEGIAAPIPDSSPWFAYVTPEQQARFDRNAFLLMQDKDYMGPMFLWNLNMSALINFDPDHAGYSIFLPPDIPRPAYDLIKNTPKISKP